MLNSETKAESNEPNQQEEALCKSLLEWNKSIESFCEPKYNEFKASRAYVGGKMGEEADTEGTVRANLSFSTLHALLPHIYAKNPDISIFPSDGISGDEIEAWKSFTSALETAVNRAFIEATSLKKIAKRCIRGALTTKIAWSKLTYQRDYFSDPITLSRIEDAQDNVARLEAKMDDITDGDNPQDDDSELEHFRYMLLSLQKEVEIPVRQGLSLQRIMPEHILVDPAIVELGDYLQSRRITQVISMPLSRAKALFPDVDLKLANSYDWDDLHYDNLQANRAGSTTVKSGRYEVDDPIVKVYETWDKDDMTVYTMIDGVKQFVKPPMQPESGPGQWYPFFPLSFYDVDGQFYGLSLIQLIRELADEYNRTRTQQDEHRSISIPTWIADKGLDRNSLERHKDATLGEVVLVDASGKPLNEVIVAAVNPPYNPAIYDTSQILRGIDMMSGLPDAQRGSLGRTKTLGEAELLDEGLNTRTSEMKDTIEEWIGAMATAAVEILLQEWTMDQVVRYVGREAAQSWPTSLTKEDIFDKIQINIRAGTSGKPNDVKERENWVQLMPLIGQLQNQMMELKIKGVDVKHMEELLKETIHRMDERMDLSRFLPAIVKDEGQQELQKLQGQVQQEQAGLPGGQGGVQPGQQPANSEQGQQGGGLPEGVTDLIQQVVGGLNG